MTKKQIDHYTGCLVGGAVGDALGAPVEKLSAAEITSRFGDKGISEFGAAYGKTGAVTACTQMTLFTAEGLAIARARQTDPLYQNIPAVVYQAYLRWLYTQKADIQGQLISQYGTCSIVDGVLTGFSDLHSKRSPDETCLTALASRKMGTVSAPVNSSRSWGGVVRTAPAGLFADRENAFEMGCDIAAITHGHPSGYLPAGVFAQIICDIIHGSDIRTAALSAVEILKSHPDHGECASAVESALNSAENAENCLDTCNGDTAAEVLSAGLYCALKASGNFEEGVRMAVNHGGRSSATGAITGSILGARLGFGAIPGRFPESLELKDLIIETAEDLF